MDFSGIGNFNTYLKNLKMQTQWNLKQQTGNYSAKGKSLDQWLDSPMKKTAEASQVQAQVDAQRENGDEKLREIHQKLEAGGKLTRAEREYLQTKDPQTYQELVAEEQEQKAYEQALRRCTTKEEVERLRMGRIGASLARVQSVEHNSAIPLSKKLEIAMGEKRRVDAVAESTKRFVESGEYAKLPTQAEESQAQKEQGEESRPAEQTPAVSGVSSGEEVSKLEENRASGEEKNTSVPGERYEIPGDKGETKPVGKETTVGVEADAERKVRRAKAKAAYHNAAQAELPQPHSTFTRQV